MDTGLGQVPPLFEFAVAAVAVLFLATVVGMMIIDARNRRVLRDSGTARPQIAARIARGPLGTPTQSLAQRLTELDDLHQRGMITDADYSAARTSALGGR